MGREIRRVPPNWEHPKDEKGHYRAMYDQDYESASKEWKENFIKWENGTHEDKFNCDGEERNYDFWEWESPPDSDYFRPKFTEKATWFQVYETVSEGTPVTPPFATKEELIDYLVEHGDFWDQSRGHGGWHRKAAEQFVEREYAPSLMVMRTETEVKVNAPRDGDLRMEDN